jgi:hypothetical protein
MKTDMTISRLSNQGMKSYKVTWIIPKGTDKNDSCYLARVLYPCQKLKEYGIEASIYFEDADINALQDSDVIIFHRTLNRIKILNQMGKITGLDLMDDLFRYSYITSGFDFLLTDSLPNTRFYQSKDTYYWPHAFHMNTNFDSNRDDEITKFVFCGNAGNVHCLLGDPLDALERLGYEKPVSLTIITNIKTAQKQSWIADLPDIQAKNYTLEWIDFDKDAYEDQMKQCDVGLFPQNITKDRWKKKSIYKTAHASSIGLPAIISPTEEALSTYTHAHNCMIAYSKEDWYQAVRSMSNHAFRNEIRNNAITLCKEKFNFNLICNQLLGIISIYLEDREKRNSTFKQLGRQAFFTRQLFTHYVRAVKKRIP